MHFQLSAGQRSRVAPLYLEGYIGASHPQACFPLSFNFGPIRILIFVACVLAFWFLDGFESTVTREDGTRILLGAAWIRCLAMFFVGAVAVSLVDHYIGTMEPQNLRLVYIFIGVVLMVGAYLLLSSAKTHLMTTSS